MMTLNREKNYAQDSNASYFKYHKFLIVIFTLFTRGIYDFKYSENLCSKNVVLKCRNLASRRIIAIPNRVFYVI